MVLRRPRPAGPVDRIGTPVEEWPFLDQGVLVPARSRKVCMTCHWFEHHAGVNCIPLLTCQLHQGLPMASTSPAAVKAGPTTWPVTRTAQLDRPWTLRAAKPGRAG
jgi:hypothetical protein